MFDVNKPNKKIDASYLHNLNEAFRLRSDALHVIELDTDCRPQRTLAVEAKFSLNLSLANTADGRLESIRSALQNWRIVSLHGDTAASTENLLVQIDIVLSSWSTYYTLSVEFIDKLRYITHFQSLTCFGLKKYFVSARDRIYFYHAIFI